MMKRYKTAFLAAFLALTMAVSMAACGAQPAPSSQPEQPTESAGSESEPTDPPPTEPSEEGSEDASQPERPVEEDSAPAPTPTPNPAPAQPQPQSNEPVADSDPPIPPEGFPESASTGVALNPSDILVYVHNGDMTVSDFTDYQTVADFATLVNRSAQNPGPGASSGASQEAGFMVLRSDYQKFHYALVPTVLQIDGVDYAVEAADYDALKAITGASVCSAYPHWLIYMNPERVVDIAYNTQNGAGFLDPAALQNFAYQVRFLTVMKGSGSTYQRTGSVGDDFTPDSGRSLVEIHFNSGVVYSLLFDGSTLYLESSDMSYGCKYGLDNMSMVDDFLWTMATGQDTPSPIEIPFDEGGQLNPETGKPVIYLYPERERDVDVKLDFKGRISYTFPEYGDGWSVTAQPDGTLTNKADGSTHYYLFWDGTADKRDWDFSEGFVVAGEDVQSFFEEKLPLLGLTPKEYNDFITYWTPELGRNPYNLITFATEEYEEIATLTVTPAPDTVLRVHMVYKPLMAQLSVPEQELPEPPEREGFTLVEWGGTRAR